MARYPCCLETHARGDLQRRAVEAIASLAACRVCPRQCGVNRLAGEMGMCEAGRFARVSSWFPHHGEENCLRGTRGSGTIFFAHCNLRCVFCQNHSISHKGEGNLTPPRELANMMLDLQSMGCHNINFVTPSHVVPQLLEALVFAIEEGLRLPLVYNTSAYDQVETLHLLDGVVDIYMPDFKYWSREASARFLTASDYPEKAKEAIREMHRQVGDLTLDEEGIAQRGLLVRHLVMPGGERETEAILHFLAKDISSHTFVNIMPQYRPAGQVTGNSYSEIHRTLHPVEYAQALLCARRAGLSRLDIR